MLGPKGQSTLLEAGSFVGVLWYRGTESGSSCLGVRGFRRCSDGTCFTDAETEVRRSGRFCPPVSKVINLGVQDVKTR